MMGVTTAPTTVPTEALALELPVGWVQFDSSLLLAMLGQEPALTQVAAFLETDPAELAEILPNVEAMEILTGVVVSALRVAEDALDILVVAVPPDEVQRLGRKGAQDRVPGEAPPFAEGEAPRELLDLDGTAVAEHRTTDSALPESAFARVQLVALAPPDNRAAVVTAVSTTRGREDELATAARAVARTLRIVPLEYA